eukprot:365072-Chlamydomonas_euryale.AAC.18
MDGSACCCWRWQHERGACWATAHRVADWATEHRVAGWAIANIVRPGAERIQALAWAAKTCVTVGKQQMFDTERLYQHQGLTHPATCCRRRQRILVHRVGH